MNGPPDKPRPAHTNAHDRAARDAPADGDNVRCHCGSLMARLVGGGVELKCRRCKRTLILPLGHPGD
jgi:hypothetical protein